MGFRYRKQVGPKGIKLNIGKNGVTSTTFKIAKGITYNTKRGLTIGIPGTGLSYNFGGKKKDTKKLTAPEPSLSPEELLAREEARLAKTMAEHEKVSKELHEKRQEAVAEFHKIGDTIRNPTGGSEYTKGWRKYTGGYNKKAMLAVGICLLLCITPLWPLGLLASIPSLLWLLIDTAIKIIRYNKHLKEAKNLKANL